jgi:type I restriction enzyme M protein
MDNLPAPEIIAREIVEDLTAALAEFEAVAVALELAAADGERERPATAD